MRAITVLAKACIQAKFFYNIYVIKANKNKHKEKKMKPISTHLAKQVPLKFTIILLLVLICTGTHAANPTKA